MAELHYPRSSRPFTFEVERGKVREIARATGALDPAYRAGDAIPPTFLTVASGWWGYSWEEPGDSPLAEEQVDPTRTLHLEERYLYERPLRIGDRLTGVLTIEQPVHKQGRRAGPMTIYTTRTAFTDQDGAVVATAIQRIAELGGPQA